MKNSGIRLEIGNNPQERQYEKVVDNKLGNIFFKCKLCGEKKTSRPVMNDNFQLMIMLSQLLKKCCTNVPNVPLLVDNLLSL